MARGRFTGGFRTDDDCGELDSRRAKIVERRCGYCDGKGEVEQGDFVSTTVACPVCRKFGYVKVPSNYERCPDCKGTGRRDIREFLPDVIRCKRCGGTGWCEPSLPYS